MVINRGLCEHRASNEDMNIDAKIAARNYFFHEVSDVCLPRWSVGVGIAAKEYYDFANILGNIMVKVVLSN